MTLKCKVGDVVFVTVRSGKHYGRLMRILEPAPDHAFTLPNGVHHSRPLHSPSWVVDILGMPFEVKSAFGAITTVSQGVAADKDLHPIPPHLLPSVKI